MIKAEIIADSFSPQGDRLVTVLATFPRIILAEVNTHRMLSKNTSSSRAIPFKKMVEAVQNNPFIPIAWQHDHKGMQGIEYVNEVHSLACETTWLEARDMVVQHASYLNEQIGVTKQICNRLLEPFMWTTMVITGSLEGGWDNFFNLRCPNYEIEDIVTGQLKHYKSKKEAIGEEDINFISNLEWLKLNKGLAEIHMMALAEAIYDAFNESTPKQLKAGEWHIPFNDVLETYDGDPIYGPLARVKISTAMCARTSYTIIGEEKAVDYNDLITLDDRLLVQNPKHSSPMEHCARAMSNSEYSQSGKFSAIDKPIAEDINLEQSRLIGLGWCRNYRGFIQRRHLIETGG